MYLLIGLLTGALSGLGVGGGAALIPLVSWFAALSQQVLQGLNLIAFLPSSAAAAAVYARKGFLDKTLLWHLIALAAPAAVLGAWLAAGVEPGLLRKLFGVFLLLLGLWQWVLAERRHRLGKKK